MNKLFKILIAASVLSAGYAHAVDPQRIGDCADFADEYQATAEAQERFSDLRGSCEGIYEINGARYARAQAVVRSNRGGTVRLYLPATDKTIEATPDSTGRVYVGNRKYRIRDLNRGDEIGIYLSMDRFFEERVTEIALATPDESAETHVVAPVQEVAALPTTASPIPAIALFSGLLLTAGLFIRKFRRVA